MTRQILVSGGTSGIGAGIAQAFRDAGDAVTAVGLAGPDLDAAAKDPAFRGIDLKPLDVSDQAAVDAFAASLTQVDVLVNCAGMIRRMAEYEMPTFLKVLDVNLGGTMRLCLACKDLLAQSGRGGAIVNTASMLSFFGGPAVPAYSASKGGVMQLTKSLAVAWAKDGIRVNAVAPGWIATPLTQALQDDAARSQVILDRTPMARWGTPADVAKAVLFLASDQADFITGAILPVDGGYAAM
ncbi:SDR family oxidoreductase [Ferrovibrio sp.]|uniref:SDR family NAD(P)-dependent oxidoreductase n=1 Tax=Ferrovibrio sp. TaxID=1917215 RepID=UPI000CBD83FA|nr:SDR family oxidoreductase [Ferrovibrio sp.]PJI39550.1 MAG: 2-deoxy-D-gluconate 3-dehydrogenase [Ferrovibrio sp.]